MAASQETIARAKELRAQRDERYGNIYVEADTDYRWAGEIGEIGFDTWLHRQGLTDYEWVLEDVAGKPDFVICGATVGVKTVKRKVRMQPDYTAQITARHAHEPVDFFFFTCYEFPRQRLWLLGGIERDRFLREARYYGPGEWVHPHYQIRSGHEIYNIEVSHLITPAEWLRSVSASPPGT